MNRQKSIQAGFSLKFQLKFCCIVAVLFAVASFLLYLLMNKSLSGTYRESLRVLYLLDQNLPVYLGIMGLLLLLFLLILTLVITLLVSHQIAGPVYRYEIVLKQILSGKFPCSVATRQDDQLKPMVESLNKLVERLGATFTSGTKISQSLDAALQKETLQKEDLKIISDSISVLRGELKRPSAEGINE